MIGITPEKPNIIYIFSDQHRGDTLGSVGHPTVITPNLDKLSAEGVNFTRCYTNSPLCMPARVSMMTGQYVCEHGIWTNENEAASLSPSHVRNIRDAGYHTAIIGKTHLYKHSGSQLKHTREGVQILNEWGFVDTHELTGPMGTGIHDSPYTDYLKEKGLLKTHRDYIMIHRSGAPSVIVRGTSATARGTAKPWDDPPCPLPTEAHLDSYTGRTTVEWIQNYKNDKPFYLQVLFPGPHNPFDSPQEYRDMYKLEDIPEGIMKFPQNPIPLYVRMLQKLSAIQDMTPEQCKQLRINYYAKITLIDDYIGRIVNALKQKGLLDNTWIIYNSDHGEMLGDHFLSHKVVFYEGATRVPLIIRPPGGVDGWKCKGLTDHLDIAATLIDIADAIPLKESDGITLVPKVQKGPNDPKAQEVKEVVFSEVYGFSMVRNDRYKMTVNRNSQKPVELFDLQSDPEELTNIVNDPSMKEVRESLKAYLKSLLKKTDKEKLDKVKSLMKKVEKIL